MHDSLIALCQEYTTEILIGDDPYAWGVAIRIKRQYYQDLSKRLKRMGYKINNMAKERNEFYFLHIKPDPSPRREVVIKHRITSDLVLDLYEKAALLEGKEKKQLMTKVKLLSQYVGGYLAQ